MKNKLNVFIALTLVILGACGSGSKDDPKIEMKALLNADIKAAVDDLFSPNGKGFLTADTVGDVLRENALFGVVSSFDSESILELAPMHRTICDSYSYETAITNFAPTDAREVPFLQDTSALDEETQSKIDKVAILSFSVFKVPNPPAGYTSAFKEISDRIAIAGGTCDADVGSGLSDVCVNAITSRGPDIYLGDIVKPSKFGWVQVADYAQVDKSCTTAPDFLRLTSFATEMFDLRFPGKFAIGQVEATGQPARRGAVTARVVHVLPQPTLGVVLMQEVIIQGVAKSSSDFERVSVEAGQTAGTLANALLERWSDQVDLAYDISDLQVRELATTETPEE